MQGKLATHSQLRAGNLGLDSSANRGTIFIRRQTATQRAEHLCADNELSHPARWRDCNEATKKTHKLKHNDHNPKPLALIDYGMGWDFRVQRSLPPLRLQDKRKVNGCEHGIPSRSLVNHPQPSLRTLN